ncbi:MAG: phosphatidate cytidylyltransferase [Bacteroidia bacterium]
MNNLLRRALTAIIAGSVAVAAIVLSHWGLWLFGLIVSMAGVWEFWNLAEIDKRYRWPSFALGALVWFSVAGESLKMLPEGLHWYLFLLLIPVLGLSFLFNEKENKPVEKLGEIVLSYAYSFIPLLLFYKISIVDGSYNFRIPLLMLLITWALDVGAFFAGKWFGKKKLFPRISPKKTWAGSIGGTLVCLLFAFLFQIELFPNTQTGIPVPWLLSGTIIAIFGQWGDLIESMFKRSSARKDSGSILPGHGGMLDRFDSMYITLPLLYILFQFV